MKHIGTKVISAFPENRPEDQEGYLVVYEDGYKSWSPKAAFEKAYRPIEGEAQALSFGHAIFLLKEGKTLTRAAWNGSYTVHMDKVSRPMPFLCLNTADGEIVPWSNFQSDALADDWQVID